MPPALVVFEDDGAWAAGNGRGQIGGWARSASAEGYCGRRRMSTRAGYIGAPIWVGETLPATRAVQPVWGWRGSWDWAAGCSVG